MARPRKQQINDTYVTTEEDTGRIWVDGRTIYRKVLRGTMNVIVGTINVPHGIASTTTSIEVISLNGGIKLSSSVVSGGQLEPLWYRETGGNYCLINVVDLTNIVFIASFAWGTSWYSIIMEYVK